MRTKGELPSEPIHTGQATYFIAKDTYNMESIMYKVKMGKGSSISQVSKSSWDEIHKWMNWMYGG